jgi:hypothetical protein
MLRSPDVECSKALPKGRASRCCDLSTLSVAEPSLTVGLLPRTSGPG